MLSYLQGDATLPQGSGPKLIAHVCNDAGGWGAGFVVPLSRRYPKAEHKYRSWYGDATFGLGMVQPVKVTDEVTVMNMVAQHGFRSSTNPTPLQYDALETCLAKLATYAKAKDASVHMPRIGAGLSGGSWPRIEALIMLALDDIDTFVYDLPK